MYSAAIMAIASVKVEWTQTFRHTDGTLTLLEDMPALTMTPAPPSSPSHPALRIDRSKRYQTLAGFGGAFTEASAINWKLLSKDDQDEVIRLYFSDPKDGGLGYTVGRVPINSCDFSPESYSFDDVEGDTELKHFDTTVGHDVDAGMVPMIQAAKAAVEARGHKLKLLASPWSPPAWMKVPVSLYGEEPRQAMTLSAKPNGLLPEMQRPWANYFSKWISAYKGHGIDVWAVTVQNEPEATAGWEAMLWTPEFMASFVRDHLGPVLADDHPAVSIFGFDHNKDHVTEWTKALYEDEAAKAYFAGVGVHWYGGLNTDKLQATHDLAPEKAILATEACNCVGNVIFKSPNLAAWWTRAEKLALDMLEDLRFWAIGWIDWNLVLSPQGGPNHLKNLCDANIIADPDGTQGTGSALIKQAFFYYMGHFSRYLLPGSVRVGLVNEVEKEVPPVSASDVKNGAALSFHPCDAANAVQQFQLAQGKGGVMSIVAGGTNTAPGSDGYAIGGECVERCTSGDCWFPKVQLWACAQAEDPDPVHGGSGNQVWTINAVPGGSQLVNPATGKCLTAVTAAGWAVGLDAGVTVTAAQIFPCAPPGTLNQTFVLSGDGKGNKIFDGSVTISSALNGKCLQPEIEQLPKFDAIAFEQPDGSMAVVVMNTNDYDVDLTLSDEVAGVALEHTLPGHAIHTYRYTPEGKAAVSLTAMPTTEHLTTELVTDGIPSPAVASVGAAVASIKGARTATGGSVVSSLAIGALLSLLAALAVLGRRFRDVTLPQLVPADDAHEEDDATSERVTPYEPFVEPRA